VSVQQSGRNVTCPLRATTVQAIEPLAVLAQRQHVAGAVHVHLRRNFERHGQVVDGGQVVDRRDLGRQALVVLVAQAEAALGDVARQNLDTAAVQLRRELLRLVGHARLDQRYHARVGGLLEQRLNEPPPDEARKSGDEDRQGREILAGRRGNFVREVADDDLHLIGPDEVAYRLDLTPAQLKITWVALKSFADDFGHDERDVHGVVREVLNKLPDDHPLKDIDISRGRR